MHLPPSRRARSAMPSKGLASRSAARIRRVTERHARQAGCTLIIDPTSQFPDLDPPAWKVRMTTLMQFLESMPDDKVRVVCHASARDAVIVAVGDWFVADSHLRHPGEGWRHTVFTWHAPTVLQKIREFDGTFDRLLAERGLAPEATRNAAIAAIRERITQLGSEASQPAG